MQERALAQPQDLVRWNKEVADVLGDEVVTGLRLRDTDDRRGVGRVERTGSSWPSATGPTRTSFRDWLEVDEKGYLVVRDETHSRHRGRLHRRRRPRPPLPAGRHRGRRRLQGGHRRRALARGAGDRNERVGDRVVISASANNASVTATGRGDGTRASVTAADRRKVRRGDWHERLAARLGLRTLPREVVSAWIDEALPETGGAALDAGCGRQSMLKPFRKRIGQFIGVDIHQPSRELRWLDEFVTADVCRDATRSRPAPSMWSSRPSRWSTSTIPRPRSRSWAAGFGPAVG